MTKPLEINDPEELEARGAPAAGAIAASTSLGAVHLTVADLARSIAYYERTVGLTLLDGLPGMTSTSPAGRRAVLGVGARALLVLVEQPGARPVTHSTGLYHFALLVPQRVDLARWLAHAAHERVALTGLSDHFVSEALYLSDPDGHGIEIYRDRPRARWEGQVAARMTTLPLDVESLLAELPNRRASDFRGLSAGTVMGHVHFKVAAVPRAIEFYRDVVGFALMAALGDHAAFLGAGGYHHHIGANAWESAGASPPPAGAVGLRHATIVLPDESERERVLARVAAHGYEVHPGEEGPLVHDPSGNALLLSVAAAELSVATTAGTP